MGLYDPMPPRAVVKVCTAMEAESKAGQPQITRVAEELRLPSSADEDSLARRNCVNSRQSSVFDFTGRCARAPG